METFVQWATILSPIIAVLLAWWTVRSSAKSTAKELAAMRDVALLQLETTIIEMEYEFFKAESSMKEYKEEIEQLRNELQQLSTSRSSEPQRQEFLDKIEKLTKDTQWQKAWWMRLFHAQAQLSFTRSRLIKKYNKM